MAVEAGKTITWVTAGMAAAKAGVQAGDEILEISGRALTETERQNLAALVMGPPGTTLALKLRRGDGELRVSVVRERKAA